MGLMRNLFDIVGKLTKEEKRHFKLYLSRVKLAGDKQHKAELLFDMVNRLTSKNQANPLGDEVLSAKLYANGDKNSFYQLKNRLLGDLEKSLLLLHSDLSDRIGIMTRMAIAELYVYKSLYKEAFDLLRQAERKATKAGYYDLLATIYDLIVKIAFNYDSIDLETYMHKQLQNLAQYQTLLQTDHLIKTLSYRLIKSNFEARDADITQTLADIQQKLSIREDLLESPRMQLEIHNTVRRILLQKQDYVALESYLIETLREFEQGQIFKKDTHVHKIVTLVWILNTLIKNGRFSAMLTYTDQLLDALNAYGKLYYDKYIWTYYQCVVTQHFYSNQLDKATQLLENLAADTTHKDGALYYDTFVHANLSVIYYCQGQLRKAMSKLTPLLQKDTFGKQSAELQLRISLLELVLHYENNDFSYIDYKANDLRNTYKELLQQETHQRESDFLKLLRRCTNLAQPFNDAKMVRAIEQFIEQSPPFSPGSNEFINYRIWLSVKLNRKNYYTTLLAATTP